jgi:hypothetical protein
LLQTDPDWEPTPEEAAIALIELTTDHLMRVREAVLQRLRPNLHGMHPGRRAGDISVANIPDRNGLINAGVTKSTYKVKQGYHEQLLNVWGVLREDMEAARPKMCARPHGIRDHRGRPLVYVLSLHRPLMRAAPDSPEFVRLGFVAMLARQGLHSVWRAGAPTYDHLRTLFTTARPRSGGGHGANHPD